MVVGKEVKIEGDDNVFLIILVSLVPAIEFSDKFEPYEKDKIPTLCCFANNNCVYGV
jgi:hypothetical protein